MKRIICVGNRFVDEDSAGPQVFDRLSNRPARPGVDVIDGGLGGLDLLWLMEGAQRVVFVDAVQGFGPPGRTVVLTADQAGQGARSDFGHAAGLAYALRVMDHVMEGPRPEVVVIGLEQPDDAALADAADLAWRLMDDDAPIPYGIRNLLGGAA